MSKMFTVGTFLACLFLISGCSDDNKSTLDDSPLKASSHKGFGSMSTRGDIADSFTLNSENGDEIICGTRNDGFQVYIGPKEYGDSNYGLLILVPIQLGHLGEFTLNDTDPKIDLAYFLEDDEIWNPDRDNDECMMSIQESPGNNLEISLSCPLKTVIGAEKNAEISVDITCNNVDMTN
jgi:hypothetical protein